MRSNQEAEHGDGEPTGAADRLLHIAGALFTVHLDIARQEMAQDQARIARGVAILAVSWMCMFAIVLLLQAVAAISLHELLGWPWLRAVLLTGVADLVLCALLRWIAKRQFKAPVLSATRAMMRRTVSALG